MAHEIFKQRIFLHREVDPLSASGHFPRGWIEHQIVDLEDRREFRRGRGEQSPDTGEQFVDGEGFGEIIVRSGIKPFDALIHFRLRRENQHRGLNFFFAQAGEHFQSRQTGQHRDRS